MKITQIKRWQWIIAGTLVGAAFAYLQTSQDPTIRDGKVMKSVRQIVFEQRLHDQPQSIEKIVIDPLSEAEQLVLLDMAGGKSEFFVATIPYEPLRFKLEKPPSYGNAYTVRDVLDVASTTRQAKRHRYRWWRESRFIYLVCIASSVLLIGGVWPTVMRRIAGEAPEQESPEYLPPTTQTPTAVSDPTPADLAALREIEQELERTLAGSGGAQSTSNAEMHDTVVTALSNDPLPKQPVAAPVEEKKDFTGEFYPVARKRT